MSYRDTPTVITAAALLLTTPVVAAAAGEGQTAVAIFAGAGDDK